MAIIVKRFDFVFNDVQFALDVAAARKRRGVDREVLGKAVGWETGGAIGQIERASYSKHLGMADFINLCNLLDLHANDYFEIEPHEGVDLLGLLGG